MDTELIDGKLRAAALLAHGITLSLQRWPMTSEIVRRSCEHAAIIHRKITEARMLIAGIEDDPS